MRILIAEDDPIARRVLHRTLESWGHEVRVARDGLEAWDALQAAGAPRLAILDGRMPGIDGPEVCRRARALPWAVPPYLLLLTARDHPEEVVLGLQSGANDYLTKPFNRQELQARLNVAVQAIRLHQALLDRVRELEEALARVKQLQGLLPMCSYCKKIRDDQNYWQQVEAYLCAHTDARFSHGICPGCWESVIKPELARATGTPAAIPAPAGR
jgi:CheY-like chemotaxis protein